MPFRYFMANLLTISLAMALLACFGVIVIYGGYYIEEPNSVILSLEILLLLGCIGFGVYNLIRR